MAANINFTGNNNLVYVAPQALNPLVLQNQGNGPAVPTLVFHNGRQFQKAAAAPKVWPQWQCAFCGTDETVQRRRGPTGRNVLCNPCGLKYKKAQDSYNESVRTRMAVTALLN